ncbi:hypothetical protein Q31b_51010 [Novipirellula aureliae]|uniref:Methyltransferase domain-containing protein n=1 Tax=Novipirellula aureliae TaxID=2527966 RepID=A0A5C6DL73_9BACT|nr:hypothetical protein [Novipirellula aureliae]TWU35666.1 hypothetical protein Q31b_51010 [Novipirellula aureliae]
MARERDPESLALNQGESVLEIGFGTGHSLVALVDAVGNADSVASVDTSWGMRDVAMKRLAAIGKTSVGRDQLVSQVSP